MLVYNKILLYLHSHIPNLKDLPLKKKMIPRFVYQMDDYFFFPPFRLSNMLERAKIIPYQR